MAKLSLKELESAVAEYVQSNKIAVETFNVTKDNIVGLVDKVGKIVTLDSSFFDKLSELNGDDLPLGKTIEEWYQDLIMAIDWDQDAEGQKALKFYSPTYRPVCYSYRLGRKIIPTSIPNGNIERAVNNESQLSAIVTEQTKRLEDSTAVWKYQVKRELLGKIVDKVKDAYDNATAFTDGGAVVEGSTYSQGGKTYVALKSNTALTDVATGLANGTLVELKIMKVLAKPTTEETGEAFIKAVKEAVEVASDVSEGYSLNGNTIGAELGLSLYVKQGVMPSLEVDTLAGSFHLNEMGMGVQAKTIKDFGATTSKVYAILMDSRGARVHTDYEAMRENFNGFGDHLSLFKHLDCTCFMSRNTFLTIFVEE